MATKNLTNAQFAKLAQRRQFAALYVSGTPTTRGDWDACNLAMGSDFVPCDKDVRKLIQDAGGILPPCEDELAPTSKGLVKRLEAITGQELLSKHDESWREKLDDLPETADRKKWCDKFKEIEAQFDDAAKGVLKITASQARVMLSIQERCFGRVGDDTGERVQSGVLLLPTIGVGSEMHVCPRCGFTEEKIDQNA